MNNKQGGVMVNTHMGPDKTWRSLFAHIVLALFFIFQTVSARADELALSGIDFASQPGDKLQIEMEMTGSAIAPKVFKTDNPARIALDFSGVKSALAKKMYPVNQGAVSSVYVVEAAGRVRVVVNLVEATPFETKVVGNKVLLTLTSAKAVTPEALKPAVAKPTRPVAAPVATKAANAVAAALIPAQNISGFDFKRGEKGEGRILVSLANPNTIVNSKEQAGKVILSFLNTRLPQSLSKRLDVSEFATPVKFIDTVSSDQQTTITVSMQNDLYDYSVVQADGLLTVEFRPLTNEEKDTLERSRTKYTGDRLSLNFQEIEIRSVIAILAEFTGQNVVAGDDVTGTITLKLDDVPWDEALDFIMMTKDLGKFETGNVTLISPLDKIKDYKKKQQETDAVVEQLDPLVTEYIKINYARADNFMNLLNGRNTGAFGSCGAPQLQMTGQTITKVQQEQSGQATGGQATGGQTTGGQTTGGQTTGQTGAQANSGFGLLSTRGSAVVDSRTNTLIIRETTKRLDEIRKLIRKLDIPVRQVMIEARVVIANDNFTENLGVKFGVAKQDPNMPSGKSFAIGGAGTRGNTVTGAGTPTNLLVDLGAAAITTTPPGALGMTLARGADYVLNLELSALQAEGKGEIVSNPRVMTMDRCTAVMTQGIQIPVTTPPSANTPATVTYKDAVLELDATPQITPSGSVIMNLLVKKDNQNITTNPNPVSGNPAIDTRQIRTSVLVEDGETVVLGGVFEGAESINKNKIPFFADLPGIGVLFTNSAETKTKQELLIFVTPKIMKDDVASD